MTSCSSRKICRKKRYRLSSSMCYKHLVGLFLTELQMPCVIAIQGSMWQNMVVDTPQNSVSYFIFFLCPFYQVSVLRLIQVVRSVEKIEKILHSQNSKEANSLESRWETMVFISYC